MIAGQRADEPVRELSPENGLEPVSAARAALRQPGETDAVIEEAADGSSVDTRRLIHGSLCIGASRRRRNPWRE
jgi:hypothetical protein